MQKETGEEDHRALFAYLVGRGELAYVQELKIAALIFRGISELDQTCELAMISFLVDPEHIMMRAIFALVQGAVLSQLHEIELAHMHIKKITIGLDRHFPEIIKKPLICPVVAGDELDLAASDFGVGFDPLVSTNVSILARDQRGVPDYLFALLRREMLAKVTPFTFHLGPFVFDFFSDKIQLIFLTLESFDQQRHHPLVHHS